MNDYIAQLDAELRRVAADPRTSRARTAVQSDRGRGRRRGISLAVGLAMAITVSVVVLSSGSSPDQASALPVLKRPRTDARPIRAFTAVVRQAGGRYEDARAFSTPSGTGYVVPAGPERVCVAVPDPVEGYGQACATYDDIARRGLIVGIAGQDGAASEFVALLPADASSVTVHTVDGRSSMVPIVEGVATVSLPTDASITLVIGSRTTTLSPGGPGRCPHGTTTGTTEHSSAGHFGRLTCATG